MTNKNTDGKDDDQTQEGGGAQNFQHCNQNSMPKTLLHLSLKEKFGLFVDFEFLSEICSWQTTNRFPLVGEKSSNGKWLRIVFEKTAHIPVFRLEMLVT